MAKYIYISHYHCGEHTLWQLLEQTMYIDFTSEYWLFFSFTTVRSIYFSLYFLFYIHFSMVTFHRTYKVTTVIYLKTMLSLWEPYHIYPFILPSLKLHTVLPISPRLIFPQNYVIYYRLSKKSTDSYRTVTCLLLHEVVFDQVLNFFISVDVPCNMKLTQRLLMNFTIKLDSQCFNEFS